MDVKVFIDFKQDTEAFDEYSLISSTHHKK